MSTFVDRDPMLQHAREKWLRRMVRNLARCMLDKFRMGAIEHRCAFGDQTVEYLLDAIEQEALDTLMYVRELKRRRKDEPMKQLEL